MRNARRPGALAILVAMGAAGWSNAAETPPLAERIDRVFARYQQGDVPGVIVGIARDRRIVHARGYGRASLEHGIPLAAETISESGSVAKQFTAAAVALLAVRGQLSLDDPIRRHLPELGTVADAITVRMLLNHTSGLRDIHGLFDLLGRPSYASPHTNQEVLHVMSRQRQLNFTPGAEYVYCNAGYILAALIVERTSRTSFNAFCTEHLFRPRGMARTRWRDDFAVVLPGRATGYAPRPAGGFRIDLPYSDLVGNGGLLTTVGDLLAWTLSFDGATGEWAEVVRLLETPSRLRDGRVLAYGLGLGLERYEGLREVYSGSTGFDTKTYEHIKNWYDTQAWLPKNAVIVNKAAFDALDAPTKQALLKAAADAEVRGLAASKKTNTDSLDKLKANGMNILPPPPQLSADMKKVGETMLKEWLDKAGPEGKQLVDAFNK